MIVLNRSQIEEPPALGGVEPADGEPVFLAAKRDGEALRFGFQRNGINGHYPIPALSMD